MNDPVSTDRPGTKIESQDFAAEVIGHDFNNSRIEWARGKDSHFQNCNFKSTLLKNCYFHRATFTNCIFTGSSIVDCNFRGAKFSGCTFEYAVIRNTAIESHQILQNLPVWENARRELLRVLRKNAEGQGDVEDVRRFLKSEMDASAEHWRSAYRQITPYYKEHYGSYAERLRSFGRFLGIKFGKFFWGHGDSPVRLASSLILWLSVCSCLVQYVSDGACAFLSWNSIHRTLALFFGIPSASLASTPSEMLNLCIVASRYVFLSLFAAVLVRRFARR